MEQLAWLLATVTFAIPRGSGDWRCLESQRHGLPIMRRLKMLRIIADR